MIPLTPNAFVLAGSLGEWLFVVEDGTATRIVNLRKFAVLVWTRYRLENGGVTPTYFLLVPYRRFADSQGSDDFLPRLWLRSPDLRSAFQSSVSEVQSETWRYRPDMSVIPE